MKKKVIMIALVLVLVTTAGFTLAACSDTGVVSSESGTTTIVYLGDSIAEAVLGPTPVNLREEFGYYSVIGRRNGYKYYNRSVSGHRTADLLEIIRAGDEDAKMTRSLIKKADIIHISILGNDLLQSNFGPIVVDAATGDGNFDKIDAILDYSSDTNGDGSRANIDYIVTELKKLNPDALIIFQNVYNPVSAETPLISDNDKITDDKGNVTYPGSKTALENLGVTPDNYRYYGGLLLERLNGVLNDYLEEFRTENPGKADPFLIMDAYAEFDAIAQADETRAKRLIFNDGIHPSNEGHAVLADLTQKTLDKLYPDKAAAALKNYQSMRKKQIDKYYITSPITDNAKKNIDKAVNCSEVTEIFFKAVKGKEVIYW